MLFAGAKGDSKGSGNKGRVQATLIGTLGPPVTPTSLDRTARSTKKLYYGVDAVCALRDLHDGRLKCANQSHLATPPFSS
ncbi:hypothetical protein Y032_0060g3125 [Ancylostoma ceylanicum]|uniref:Uncharacterized protein n=1 Tax=Ancylostoma ceylanicum TaxID=53326 RepID=A0A016U3A3_9BILA|nr:hypothetical protein Y032_0060g3125 [Ancylostoma ceylanicum]